MPHKPQVSMIVAMTDNGVIGSQNKLLWHLPNDLQYFKAVTMGKPIIMGRKTFDSIKRPLPGRQNIVLTRQDAATFPGCDVVSSVEEALKVAKGEEVMIVGGAEIYKLFLPLATKMYVTWVDANLSGETVFPLWNRLDWEVQSEEAHVMDQKHAYAYTFTVYHRGTSL